MLREHGFRVHECGTLSQLDARSSFDSVVVDIDHARQDVRVLLHQVRQLATDVIPVGTAIRQAAAIGKLADAGVETPHGDARSLVAAAIGERPRPSAELARLVRVWGKLTPRQRDGLRWLATGLDNRAIAARVRVGERAVKLHVSALLDVFGLTNRAELALYGHRAGMQPPRS